jgi:hypothetical protein
MWTTSASSAAKQPFYFHTTKLKDQFQVAAVGMFVIAAVTPVISWAIPFDRASRIALAVGRPPCPPYPPCPRALGRVLQAPGTSYIVRASNNVGILNTVQI